MTLLAAYAFDEGSGTTSADAVGTRHLTGLASTANWTATGHTNSGLARSGSATVSLPTITGLQTAQRTLMFWARRTDTANGWWVQFYISGADTAAWGVGNISGSLYSRIRIGSTNTNLTTTPPATNTWAHVAITYDGTTFRAYLNGTQYASQAVSGTIATATSVVLFDPGTSTNLDDLRFYDTALSAAEIQTAMNTPVGAATPSEGSGALTYAWTLDASGEASRRGAGSLAHAWQVAGSGATATSGAGALTHHWTLDAGGRTDKQASAALTHAWTIGGAGQAARRGSGSLMHTWSIAASTRPLRDITLELGTPTGHPARIGAPYTLARIGSPAGHPATITAPRS